MFLIYTFRTFPWIEDLQKVAFSLGCKDVFVFGKLKDDLKRFFELIEEEKPQWIIGVARGRTGWDKQAFNKFNQYQIIKSGVEYYDLYVPDSQLPLRQFPEATFCNWTAYRINDFLNTKNQDIKLSFVHLRKADLPRLGLLRDQLADFFL